MKNDNNISKKRNSQTNTVYSTFAVLFYINRQKIKKNGMCPLMGRISINAEVAQFSAGIDIDPSLWNAKAYRMTGKSRYAAEVNYQIKQLNERINRYYKQILNEQGYITAELVKNAVSGIGRKKENLLELFHEHNEEYAKQIGVTRSKGSIKLMKPSVSRWSVFCISITAWKIYRYGNWSDPLSKRLIPSFVSNRDLPPIQYLPIQSFYGR